MQTTLTSSNGSNLHQRHLRTAEVQTTQPRNVPRNREEYQTENLRELGAAIHVAKQKKMNIKINKLQITIVHRYIMQYCYST